MVIALSGVQNGLKSNARLQNGTKIARHEVQFTLYYIHLVIYKQHNQFVHRKTHHNLPITL